MSRARQISGPRYSPRSVRGFTLLELLIVMVVFAVMATMAYGGLSQVLKLRTSVERQQARTEAYQMLYQRMRRDFQNGAKRSARDNDGVLRPAVLYDSYSKRLEFTHGGWPNPLYLARTGFERVAYRLEDDKLVRSSWRVLDRASQSQAIDLTMLDGVDEMKWRFLGSPAQNNPNPAPNSTANDLQWSDSWPVNFDPTQQSSSNMPPPPAAVELTLRTHDWGSMRFLFKLGFDPNGK